MTSRFTTLNASVISQNSTKTGDQRLLNDSVGNVNATFDDQGMKTTGHELTLSEVTRQGGREMKPPKKGNWRRDRDSNPRRGLNPLPT